MHQLLLLKIKCLLQLNEKDIYFFIFFTTNLYALEIRLEKIIDSLNKP